MVGIATAALSKEWCYTIIFILYIYFADLAILPVQIIDLAVNGRALRKKQASETSVKLRQLAELLSAQAGNIKKYIEDHQLQSDSW
jgi:hypothetical protein